MRKTSKLLATLTAFLIIVSMFIFPVNAASVNYSVTSVSGSQGSQVTVTVKMSSSVDIWGANVSLGFNSSELQYVSSAKGGIVSGGSLHQEGSTVNFSGMYNAKSGTVFTVTFKILKSSGTSKLTLSSTENTDSNGATHSCSASGGTVTISKAVTGISLDKSSVTLKKGETTTLTASVTPSDATDKTVTYSSSNTKVATVNSSGKVTAVGGGSATITAKAGGKTATCKVTVNVPQTGITASGGSSKTVAIGSTTTLKIAKTPSDATDNYSTTWTSANTSIATVSSKGVVTGVALGETTITAKQNNWTVTFKITVTEKATESSTEESSTEELSTEESTTETTTASTTEWMTIPEETTDSSIANQGGIKGFINNIIVKLNDENNKVSRVYHYAMLFGVSVAVAIISVAVTFFVTSGYYKNKDKKKENEEISNNNTF